MDGLELSLALFLKRFYLYSFALCHCLSTMERHLCQNIPFLVFPSTNEVSKKERKKKRKKGRKKERKKEKSKKERKEEKKRERKKEMQQKRKQNFVGVENHSIRHDLLTAETDDYTTQRMEYFGAHFARTQMV